MMLTGLSLALLHCVTSQTHTFVALSPAPPSTVVVWGAARFSFLSDTLVRLELAGRQGFDDRQSFAIVNRSALPPPFIQVTTNNNTLVVTTDSLTLNYFSPSGNTSSGGSSTNQTCPQIQNADVTGSSSRVPDYPKGAIVKEVGDCCLMCGETMACNAWVFDPNATADPGADPFGTNCWLLSGSAALQPSSHRMGGLFNLPTFNASYLNVTFNSGGEVATWTPSMTSDKDPGNLKGVWHANDCYAPPSQCIPSYESSLAPGLLSQSGWALLDDTHSARFVPTSGVDPSPIPYWYANASASDHPQADLYLFAGGLNYSKTLYEYSKVGGASSLPARSVFGVWWSHWQPFTQEAFTTDILGGYANFSLPLDHAVLDVDWHSEESGSAAKPCYSYGGWTVNTALWPQWESFLSSSHDGTNPTGYKLKVLLNLHPQGGFDACQKYWPAFSELTGYTNASRIMPCTFGVQKIAAATFTAYMDFAELSTIDAWWVDFDYQGDCFDAPSATVLHSGYPGMAWNNEVFAGHNVVRGRRPLVLSRSGGIGDHRNPIRFTGDMNQHREILKWEIFATPTSANALFNTISNDIGGFMCNSINQTDCSGDPTLPSNGLLYLRWIQAGITFPVLRTHASTWNIPKMERRVWEFPQYFPFMADALRLRSALLPYTYSAAADARESGVATMHPLYYEWSAEPLAYTSTEEYLFGGALLASPIWETNATVVVEGVEGGYKTTWLPPLPGGEQWCTFNGTSCRAGGGSSTSPVYSTGFFSLGDTPLFARSGSIIPMQTLASVSQPTPDPLVITVFPFAPGQESQPTQFSLYEDDAETLSSGFWRVPITASPSTVTVGGAVGAWVGSPEERGLEFRLRGWGGKVASKVAINGVALSPGAEGCVGGCYFTVGPSAHTLASPEGTLVVVSPGKLPTGTANTLEVQ